MKGLSLKKKNNTENKSREKTNKKAASKNKQDKLTNEGLFYLPVKEIENSFIITDDNRCKLIIKVSPLNDTYFDEDDLEEVSNNIFTCFNIPQNSIGIYIQKEKLNIDKNIDKMTKFKENIDNIYQEMVQEWEIDNFVRSKTDIKNVNTFYLVIESILRDGIASKNELVEWYNLISKTLEEVGITTTLLSRKEILNLLHYRLNPIENEVIEIGEDMEIQDILPQTAIIYEDGKILKIEDKYYRHICLTGFTKEVNKYRWLKNLFNYDESIFIGITCTKKEGDITGKINKTISKKAVSLLDTGKKFTQKRDLEKDIEEIDSMYDKLSDANDTLLNVNITISIAADEKKQLEDKYRKILSIVNSYRFKSMTLLRKEFDPFFATLPILHDNKITKNYTHNLFASDIAALLPFSSLEHIEEDGFVVGKNMDSNSLVICNPYAKKYNNPHQLIIADSGGGKTYQISCMTIRELPQTDYTIMFDVAGTFKNFNWATTYIISPSGNIVINPFYIRGLEEKIAALNNMENKKEADEDLTAPITTKILNLMSFFKRIIPDMNAYRINIFDDLLRKTYEYKNLSDENIPKDFKFPTFNDFETVIKKEIEDATNDDAKKEREYIYDSLKPYIDGSFSKIFNGENNWDYKMHTIFDLSRLSDILKPAVYELLLDDAWGFCVKDGDMDNGTPPRKSIIIDEAHVLADERTPKTLEFISEKLIKQGRKYMVKVTIATQNFSDFLSIKKHGQAILGNCFFKLFLRLGENDQKIAKELYGFSEKEIKLLAGGKNINSKTKGKGIYIIGAYKIPIETFAFENELQIVDPQRYKALKNVGI